MTEPAGAETPPPNPGAPPLWYSILVQLVLMVGALIGWAVLIAVWATNGAVLRFEDEDVALGVLDAGVTLFVGLLGLLAAFFAAAVAWKGVQRQVRLQTLLVEREDAKQEWERENRALAYSTELVGSVYGAALQARARALEAAQCAALANRKTFADGVSDIFAGNLDVSLIGSLKVQPDLFFNGAYLVELRDAVARVMVRLSIMRDTGPTLPVAVGPDLAQLTEALEALCSLCKAYNTFALARSVSDTGVYIDILGRQIREHFNG